MINIEKHLPKHAINCPTGHMTTDSIRLHQNPPAHRVSAVILRHDVAGWH